MKRKIHREDIIEAGLELMFLNGYNATGIKEITDFVKIPKGSFYNHFKNKEEFGLEVLQFYCDNGVKMHKKNLLFANSTPLQRLKDFYAGMISSYVQRADYKLGCFMSNFSQELGDINENFRKVLDIEFDKCEAVIVQCLNEAKTQGEISEDKDTDQIGSFILNSWHGALMRMKSTANRKPLDDFYHSIFDRVIV